VPSVCYNRNRFQAQLGLCSLLLFCLAPNAQHLLCVFPISVKNLLERIKELSNRVSFRVYTHGLMPNY
jgi:hypothetical protein